MRYFKFPGLGRARDIKKDAGDPCLIVHNGDAGIYMSMKRRRTHDGPINIYQRISTPKAATLKLGESGGTVRMGQ